MDIKINRIMKTPKPNWKKKYEETAGLLKLARDGNVLLDARALAAEKERDQAREACHAYRIDGDLAKKELAARPQNWACGKCHESGKGDGLAHVCHKIVEKEVLPKWIMPLWAILYVFGFYLWVSSRIIMNKLQQPILQPYEVPVLMQGGVSDEVFNSLGLELISCKSKLMDCNHDYRHMRQQGCNP